MGEEVEVGRRARPTQARSVATLERILDAARQVLVERGVQGFNTNVVAEVAGVNVGTLYHYFADKNAVLREIFERNEVARRANLAEFARRLVVAEDLGAWSRYVVKTASSTRASAAADLAVRRACRAIPELAAADDAADAAGAQLLGPAVRERYPFLPVRRATMVAWMLIDVVRSVLDHVGDHPDESGPARKELEIVLRSYLGEYEAQRQAGAGGVLTP